MAKPKIIDIDAEFEGIEFDEKEINRITGIRNYYATVSDEVLQERGQNISKAKKGKESNHKGKTRPWAGQKRKIKSIEQHTEETKAKISAKKKGQIPWNKGLPGQPPANKGIPMSQASKDKIRLSKNARACKTPYGLFQFFSTFCDYCIQENIFPNRKTSNIKNFLRSQFAQHVEGYEYITQEEYVRLTGHNPFDI